MTWWQIENPSTETLLGVLDEALAAYADRALTHFGQFAQVVLHVAQYWDDQANDEVHGEIVFETRATTPKPHECDASPDSLCRWCDAWDALQVQDAWDFAWPGWHFEFKRAIEPYCLEGGSQNWEMQYSYLPYARVLRGRPVERITEPVRPWMVPDQLRIERPAPDVAPLFEEVYRRPAEDGPRQVLADLLQARGDVRGRFMALQLHPNPTAAMRDDAEGLWIRHRNAFLGCLLPGAYPVSCVATRGFVSTLAYAAPGHSDDAQRATLLAELNAAPEWATVDHLILDEDHGLVLLPVFQGIRVVEVPSEAVKPMSAAGAWQCEVLVAEGYQSSALAALVLPQIRCLEIKRAQDDFAALRAAAWWPQLERIKLTATVPAALRAALQHPLARVEADWFEFRLARLDERTVRIGPLRDFSFVSADDFRQATQIDAALPDGGRGWTIDAAWPVEQVARLNAQGAATWRPVDA